MANKTITSSPTVISDKTGIVSSVAQKKSYTDLNLNLTLHPFNKDIVSLKDDAAIKNSVKNLILTNFFERPFQAELGSNLKGLLFEPADAITELALEDNITAVLSKEPRIGIVYVEVNDRPNDNSYMVTLKFKIKQSDELVDLELVLRRLR